MYIISFHFATRYGWSKLTWNICIYTRTNVQNTDASTMICSKNMMHVCFSVMLTITRRVLYVEQELLNRLEHSSSPPFCSGDRVARSLGCWCSSCCSIVSFLCSVLSIDGFWLPLWYFQKKITRNFSFKILSY